MCGIIGYVGPKDPKPVLLEGLKRLEYRGYDSSGIALKFTDRIEVVRAEGRISALESKLEGMPVAGSQCGVGHTRWATHGAPSERNAHPHRVGNVVLVHNGIIENYAEHKQGLIAKGRQILSDTDSEIVAHLIDEKMQGGMGLQDAVRDVLPSLRGSYAFVVMAANAGNELVGVRNGTPLLLGIGDGEMLFASDVQAVLPYTRKVVYLEDGQFGYCRPGEFKVLDRAGAPLRPEVKTIEWAAEEADRQGYPHYMLKEIHEQPRAITSTIEGNIDHRKGIVSLSELKEFTPHLKKVNRVVLVACGTSKHAALVGKYYLEQFARLTVEVDFASEFRYRHPVLEEDTLCVFISQSGETADTLAALREVKERKLPTLAICNVRDSSLAREADMTLYTSAGPEIGVASTKAFTTQLTVLYMLAVELGHLKASLFDAQYRELTQDLVKLPYVVEKALASAETIKKLTDTFHQVECFFYIARGINYPIALEGALKLKEISYVHAEGYPGGELKHGPIALITSDVAIVALNPLSAMDPPYAVTPGSSTTLSRTYYEKMLSNIEEVKARGGRVIGIGTDGDEHFKAASAAYLSVPSTTWALNPIVLSIPVQLFAYYVAVKRGTDVDKPRNLAKSVTVE